MKFTLSWLKDYLDTDASLEQITEKLTMIGLEVEGVDDKSAFQPFTIAKVLTAEQHPDADKLRVLSVDNGSGTPIQVVCGAPNAKAGLIGAFAGPGTYVPGIDVTLGVGNIRGVESFGMMCSERELEMSDAHDGIIELPDDAPIGTPFAAYAGLDDPIIEIGLTPNRPDCTGVYGIARDLAAAGLGTLKEVAIAPFSESSAPSVAVTLDFPEGDPLCLGFGHRTVKNLKNGPSPKWMQQRLIAIGLRPINALVDITNYVTFSHGRPLHVFDRAKVHGNLVVRRGRDGEELLALNGHNYALSADNCVIADDNGPESIAGIIGGEVSGCDEGTTEVVIESALWDPMNIARTGRDLGIITDARYRFERGIDPRFMATGLDMATRLVLDLCGTETTEISEPSIIGYEEQPAKRVNFPFAEVKRLTGISVDNSEIVDILTRLGFTPMGTGDEIDVGVPSWRPDVEGKADLVEEVMRIHGINEITPQPLAKTGSVNGQILTTLQIRTRNASRALATRGMAEAVTWSFISEKAAKLFGGGAMALKLSNPIAADMSDMRPSLLPGLIQAANRNARRGMGDVALFEVSGIYEDDTAKGQRRVAGGIRRGTAGMAGAGRDWAGNAKLVTVFDAKADAFAALEAAGAPTSNLMITADAPDYYHPGRSGTIKLGPKNILGHFGEFHPNVLEGLDASGAHAGFEVYLDSLPEGKKKASKTKPRLDLSDLQALTRDFAFVVDDSISADKILKAAKGADKKLITAAKVFDLFAGPSLSEGKKSVGIELTLQPMQATLTDEDLDALMAKVVASVTKATGGELRG